MAASGDMDVVAQVTEWERLGQLDMEAGLLEFGFSTERVVQILSLDQSEEINFATAAQLIRTKAERTAFLALVGRNSSRVKRLYLDDCALSQNEVFALCVNLRSNVNVELLDLRGTLEFGTEDGCALLGSALTNNVAVRQLDLIEVNMDSQALKILLDLLQENKTLSYIDLSRNPLSEEGVRSVGEFLKKNSTLKYLGISWTDVHEGEKFMASALEVNTSLEELRFGGNTTLQELDLSFCKGLSPTDVQDALIDLLRFSGSGLTHIDLTETQTGSLQEVVNEELRKNREYRAKLRGQTKVQSVSGRLVLCGYGFAGKTAILKTMERIERGTPVYHPFSIGWKKLWQTFPGLPQFLLGKGAHIDLANRTRGFSVVGFNKQRYLKFIWDLAGQREYYALHDYLFPNIKNSCFLYVCSCRSLPDAQNPNGLIKSRDAMKNECEFWMKFIASNSKTVQAQEYPGHQLPSVRFVLTKKDTLDPNETIISKQWAELVVRELRECFKDAVDLCETVEVVNAHSSQDVKHLLAITNDSLEVILAHQEEYAICEEVRKVSTKLSLGNPVMSIDDFQNIREGRFNFRNVPTPVREAVLAYLNDIGEVISPKGFDFVADPRWFGVRVLGSLIDAFKGVEDNGQPKIWGCINVLQQGSQSGGLVHNHGYVDMKDVKNLLNNSLQTTHLQQTISSDQLVDLMIHLELCFKREPGNVDSPLFLPALFDDNTETAARGKRQLGWKLLQKGSLHYLGRRLECENKAITFLAPGFFPRLQVHLRNYIHEKKWTENPGFAVDRNLICFAENGIEILVEYSGDIDYFVDVLVRSSAPYSVALKVIEEHVLRKIIQFCASPQGCQGVTLVEAVIRPVCVRDLHWCVKRKDHSVLVSALQGRLEENKGYRHTWREQIEDVGTTDFALDLLDGEGSYRSSITSPDILWSTAAGSGSSPTNQFPRLFYPTIEDVGVLRMLDGKLNPAKKMAIKLHLLCDHKDGFHKVGNQPGRTIMLNLKAGGYDVPITKLAIKLLWAGVGVATGITGANINLPDIDNWIQRLFNVPEMPGIDAQTLQQMMNRGKSHARISEQEILKALAQYWEIDPYTQGLKEILNLQDGRSFWNDFQLRKVVYSEASNEGKIGWVCNRHYREGLQQRILDSTHH